MKFLLIYVPNLRFNGYTENWQKYRTIELGQMQRGKSKHRPRDDEKLYGGAYPFIQTGDIKKANLYIKEYERTYSNYGLSQSKLWSKGTLCITIAANIAETAILGLNACFPDSVIGWISNEKITNNIFIKYYFDFYKTQLKRLSVGGAQENLNLDKLENVYFHIPTLPEQNDITNLLTKIDELIETQIKIINDYKMLKKSIVERIISTTDISWNKYSFKDIFRERKEFHVKDGTIIHATLSKEGIYPKTDRYDRDFLVKDEDKKYKVSYLNDICYNPANLKFGVITRNDYGKCIVSPIYVTYMVNPGFNPKFIELFVTRTAFLKEIRRYEQGTVYERMAVSSDDFLTFETKLPNVEVQNDIVDNIDMLDKKITQEQEYLELLDKQKDYLLSNMFI